MILFDFECPNCGNIFEELVHKDKLTETCPECSSEASRMISAPRVKLDGCSGDFPGEYLRWERIQREKVKKSKEDDWK
jgi:putative FmdB family regulatory protein